MIRIGNLQFDPHKVNFLTYTEGYDKAQLVLYFNNFAHTLSGDDATKLYRYLNDKVYNIVEV